MRKCLNLLALSLLISSCTIILNTSNRLEFSSVTSISTYTCKLISLSAMNGQGVAYSAPSNLTVTLSGLGNGRAYSSLSDCRSGANSTSTLFLSAGASALNFYFRTSVAESLTITASTSGLLSASFSVNSVLFQVLGQATTTELLQNQKGLYAPSAMYSDGTRLFVADRLNHRVLVWNTIPTSNATVPSFALGQMDLNSIASNQGGAASGQTMSGPTGVFSDGTRLFVADKGNSRILVWNTMPTTMGQTANFALGQPNLTGATANNGGISASTLYAPTSVYSDGTKVWVADTSNHRVLVWNTMPAASGVAADFVLGQSSFAVGTPNTGGISGARMNYPYCVYGVGVRIFVCDGSNHRILVWAPFPTATGATADYALGQANLTSAVTGSANSQLLETPISLYSDGTKLYAADAAHSRILVWNAIPTVNNEAASFVLGQPNFTNNTIGLDAASTYSPNGVYGDGTHIYIADTSHHRVLIWNPLPTTNGASAAVVLGQSNFTSALSDNIPSGASVKTVMKIFSDGTRLFAADQTNNRVLVWNQIPVSNGESASFAIGQPDLTSSTINNGGRSAISLWEPSGVFSDGVKLYIADAGNNRVLVWNSIPTTFGVPADIVLGQSSLTGGFANGGLGSVNAVGLDYPSAVHSDGTRVLVADSNNYRVVIWNTIPTASGTAANLALGAPNLTTQGTGAISATTIGYTSDVQSDGTHILALDTTNSRVMIWNSIPVSSGAAASVCIGQPDCNTLAVTGANDSSLDYPSSLYYDGARLFVSDTVTSRVMIWNSLPTVNGQAASYQLGQGSFLTATANYGGAISASNLYYPFGIYSDGTRVFIGDYNGRILIMPVPGI